MNLSSKVLLRVEVAVLVVIAMTVFFSKISVTWLYVALLLVLIISVDHFRKKAEMVEFSVEQRDRIVVHFLDSVYVFSELEDRGYVLNVGAKAYWDKGDLGIAVNDDGTVENYSKPQFETEELGQGVLLVLNSKLALYFRHGHGVGLVFCKQ